MTAKTIIPIGPYHPLQEEPELFKLYCEGEIVKDIEWETGYNHRGIEKINESKTWDQIFFVVERICGICSTSHPFAYANAVEELARIEIPDRAKYIRSVIGELERIHSHLLWLGLMGHFLGYQTIFMWSWKYRETVLDIFEMITGNRNNYAMFKTGGVRRDIPVELIPAVQKLLDQIKPKADLLKGTFMDDPVIHARTKGIGILTKEDIRDFGAVGPVARASGIAIDVRKDDPYAAYPLLDWQVVTAQDGDVYSKIMVRIDEIYQSVSMIGQCLNKLKTVTPGKIDTKIKEIPEGVAFGRAEAPRGEVFHFIKSDGSNTPVRHKIRAPSYVNVATFKKSCIGQTISDATIILAAADPCYCCTERMATACDYNSRKPILDGNDLARLSCEKSNIIKMNM